ncbi:MAG: EfeM/EfeO family lipoprotein [Polyangiaceae bacterium]
MFARVAFLAAVGLAACTSNDAAPAGTDGGSSGPVLTDEQYSAMIVASMHDALLRDIVSLSQAALDMQTAAPLPTGRGWNATMDAAAIASMKDAWVRARTAYEHVEGAFVSLFPDIDNALDARYDDFMGQLAAAGGDAYLFDEKGVTGLHAIERVLYVDTTPANVVAFEKVLPGYVPAAFPATEQEAADFKNKLCTKLIADVKNLQDQWTPAHINIAISFQGLISLMAEQREKVTKASTNEEESRYSQRTMADIRDNLDGTTVIYGLFQPWIKAKTSSDPTKDGTAIDAKILAGFDGLKMAYAAVQGDAIPQPPSTWSAQAPSAQDLQTPFGVLYTKVKAEVDPNADGSVVFEMNSAAGLLGFPLFKQ